MYETLGAINFKIQKRHGRYFVNGGSSRNNGFGWANKEVDFKTKEEAIKSIIQSVETMYIKDIPNAT